MISNYEDLKIELQKQRNHFFFSQTDTEVIAHLIEEAYQAGCSVEDAFLKVLRRLEGTFAVAMISSDEPQKIFCASQESPLILGINGKTKFVASNIEAFLPYTGQAVSLNYGEYAVVSSNDYYISTIASTLTC